MCVCVCVCVCVTGYIAWVHVVDVGLCHHYVPILRFLLYCFMALRRRMILMPLLICQSTTHLSLQVYVAGTLGSPDQYLVDIGTGYYVEKNAAVTIAYYKRREVGIVLRVLVGMFSCAQAGFSFSDS